MCTKSGQIRNETEGKKMTKSKIPNKSVGKKVNIKWILEINVSFIYLLLLHLFKATCKLILKTKRKTFDGKNSREESYKQGNTWLSVGGENAILSGSKMTCWSQGWRAVGNQDPASPLHWHSQ